MKTTGTWVIDLGGRPLNGHWHHDSFGLSVVMYWLSNHWTTRESLPIPELSPEALLLGVAEVFYQNRGSIPREITDVRLKFEKVLLDEVAKSSQTIAGQSVGGKLRLEMEYVEGEHDVRGKMTLTVYQTVLTTKKVIVPTKEKSPKVLVDTLWPVVTSQWLDTIISAAGIEGWKNLAGDFLAKAGLPASYTVPEPLETS